MDGVNPISNGTRNDYEQNRFVRWLNRSTKYSLEFPVFLLFFSWNLTSTVFQNQIIYQTCTSLYDFNGTFCEEITNDIISDDLSVDEIEKYASKIFMVRAVLENIIPAIISFFIGPWSDRYGRKPILISAFLGYFLIYLILGLISLISSNWNISPWYYLLAFIPISVLGGTCALITSIYCFMSDISRQEDRAFRMARMEAAVFCGLLLGALSCSYLYNMTSAAAVFFCAAVSSFIALLYLIFFIQESVQNISADVGKWYKFKALFEFSHISDMFRTCFKRREGNARAIIWLTIIPLALMVFVMEGAVSLSYLFMRRKFGWTIDDYNQYVAANIIVQILGNVIGIYILSKKFGISETIIAVIAFGSSMTEYIIDGVATHTWIIYLATVITLLKGVASPMCRSMMASVIPTNEIGKIFSMTTSLESLSPIGSAPLYNAIFEATINTNPGAFNFVSAIVHFACIVMILTTYSLQRRRQAVPYGLIS